MMHLAKITVSLLVLSVLIWLADGASIWDRLRGADLGWLGVALIALTASTIMMARRWQIVAAALEIEIGYVKAVAEYYIAQLVNIILPGGVAGDITRAVRVRKKGDMVRAAQSVAAERIVGQVNMFALMAFGFLGALVLPGGLAWPKIAWLGIACVTIAGIVAVSIAGRSGATARFLALTIDLIKKPSLFGCALATNLCLILSLYACARATGTIIPAEGLVTLIPLILSSMLIPLSVGGWGWREGAAAALFPLIGATASAGIATGIAYGAMMMVAALPALFFILRRNPALSQTTQPKAGFM
ncbi:MAG: lysylphosphatidylglycerol synthase transmembrane domain-containing protein [Paracoccaceae bacterium]